MADRMRRGHQDTSPFHAYLEQLFSCHVDVQWTTGRLNYINGYTTKAHDAMDFRLGSEFTDSPVNDRWPTTYRLLCRKTVCIPAVALWFREAEQHTGTYPVRARVRFGRVADGAGHLSDHFDLIQIYSDPKPGSGRWRLLRKTPPHESTWGSASNAPPMPDERDVKIGQLAAHHDTIVAAIAKHPLKRARALSTVLQREHSLLVKWKALQNYVLRKGLWKNS